MGLPEIRLFPCTKERLRKLDEREVNDERMKEEETIIHISHCSFITAAQNIASGSEKLDGSLQRRTFRRCRTQISNPQTRQSKTPSETLLHFQCSQFVGHNRWNGTQRQYLGIARASISTDFGCDCLETIASHFEC